MAKASSRALEEIPNESMPDLVTYAKSNSIIAIGGKATITQLRMLDVFILNSRQFEWKPDSEYTITLAEYRKITKTKSRNTKALVEAVMSLTDVSLRFNIFNPENNDEIGQGSHSIVEYAIYDKRSGTVRYKFVSVFDKLAVAPASNYTVLDLADINAFSSPSAYRLYQFILSRYGIGSTGIHDVAKWKSLLGVTEQTAWRNFRDKKLQRGLDQIQAHRPDLVFQLEFFKKNRTVKSIRIKFGKNNLPSAINAELVEALQDKLDLDRDTANDICIEYTPDQIQACLKFILKKVSQDGITSSKSGYFLSLIESGKYIMPVKRVAHVQQDIHVEKSDPSKYEVLRNLSPDEYQDLYDKAVKRLDKFNKSRMSEEITPVSVEATIKGIMLEILNNN